MIFTSFSVNCRLQLVGSKYLIVIAFCHANSVSVFYFVPEHFWAVLRRNHGEWSFRVIVITFQDNAFTKVSLWISGINIDLSTLGTTSGASLDDTSLTLGFSHMLRMIDSLSIIESKPYNWPNSKTLTDFHMTISASGSVMRKSRRSKNKLPSDYHHSWNHRNNFPNSNHSWLRKDTICRSKMYRKVKNPHNALNYSLIISCALICIDSSQRRNWEQSHDHSLCDHPSELQSAQG